MSAQKGLVDQNGHWIHRFKSTFSHVKPILCSLYSSCFMTVVRVSLKRATEEQTISQSGSDPRAYLSLQ